MKQGERTTCAICGAGEVIIRSVTRIDSGLRLKSSCTVCHFPYDADVTAASHVDPAELTELFDFLGFAFNSEQP